jgi:Trk K+ transport system NAD-binding subunit
MSTLGFGDITFHTDLGRSFSMVVLLTGMIFLLVILPFTIIEFFYAPYIKAQAEARAPRELPPTVREHTILTNFDPVSGALIQKLNQYQEPYVLLTHDLQEALQRHDLGYNVVVGEPDLPGTYERLRVRDAALVVATGDDKINTNVAFTVRELSPTVPIITLASSNSAEEILKLAGSSRVLRLHEMMGHSLARRMTGGDARAHVIGRFDELLIAEAIAVGTPLVGKTLRESRLREIAGVNVVGVWERGQFETPRSYTRLGDRTVLVLAGSREQLRRYDELFCIYHVTGEPVIIIGGGRVGQATASALDRRKIAYRIVERRAAKSPNDERILIGDAAEVTTLEKAGIERTPAVIVTPRSDDTNIYLTLLIRRLRSDVQIISRATLERNVSTLHRAGADFVMSYASMGANAIFNALRKADVLMLAEGLSVFRLRVPPSLARKTLGEARIREETDCSIIAITHGSKLQVNPPPDTALEPEADLVLIGTVENEERFVERYARG